MHFVDDSAAIRHLPSEDAVNSIRFRVVSLILACAVTLCSECSAQRGSADLDFEAVRASVVTFHWIDLVESLQGSDNGPIAAGTAFFIEERLLVTNWHVAAAVGSPSAFPVLETIDGRLLGLFDAKLVWSERDRDLALIRVPARFQLMVRHDSALLPTQSQGDDYPPPIRTTLEYPPLAESLFVIGSPLGLSGSISEGIVSSIRVDDDFGEVIQITAPLSPGSSGSPVINGAGQAFAVATMRLRDGERIGFAVPLSSLPGRPVYEEGTDLSEWARSEITDAERKAVRRLYESSRDDVLGRLQHLKERGDRVGGMIATESWLVQADDLQRVIESIRDCLPDRLDPTATTPPAGHWRRAMHLLESDPVRLEFWDSVSDDAQEAWAIGTDENEVIKWIADVTLGRDCLRVAEQTLASDEAVRWQYASALLEKVRGCFSLSTMTIGDLKARGMTSEGMASFVRLRESVVAELPKAVSETERVLERLRTENARWNRVPEYWHALGKYLLAVGRMEAADNAFCKRLLGLEASKSFVLISSAMQFVNQEGGDLGPFYEYALKVHGVDVDSVVAQARSRLSVGRELDREGLGYDSNLLLLKREASEIVAAIEHFGEGSEDISAALKEARAVVASLESLVRGE